MTRIWLVIALVLAAGPLAAGEHSGGKQAPPIEPIVGPPTPLSDMMLDVQRLQARMAKGDRDAYKQQRLKMKEVGAAIAAAGPDAFKVKAERDAVVVYLLSGGLPRDIAKIVDKGMFPQEERGLLRGATGYVLGQEKDADALIPYDPRAQSLRLGSQLAYAQSVLLTPKDAKKALELLDLARLLAPGTLIEEAALRRQVLLVGDLRQPERVAFLARQYVERYGNSLFAGNFVAALSETVVRFDLVPKPEELSKFSSLVNAAPPEQARAFLLSVARASLLRGRFEVASQAAQLAVKQGAPGPEETARARLYDVASRFTQMKEGEVKAALAAIAPDKLTPPDRDILAAASFVDARLYELPPLEAYEDLWRDGHHTPHRSRSRRRAGDRRKGRQMTALAVQAAVAAPAQSAAPAAAKGDTDSGFAAVLGHLKDVKDAAKSQKDEAADAQDGTDPTGANVLQSLEAALASLAALPAQSKAAAATAQTSGSSLDATLSAAADALEASGWDVSGNKPLKSLLQSDPSLGLTDFQVKTFLAAAGATPAKAGAAALGTDSAWSPLEVAKAALDSAMATGDVGALAEGALPAAKAAATLGRSGTGEQRAHVSTGLQTASGARSPGLRGLSLAELHGLSNDPTTAAAVGSATAASHGQGGDASDPGTAAAAAVQAAATDSAATNPTVVPFADLPNFIADQAATLTTQTSDTTAAPSSGATQTPKAAQAVKELHIALDPADLGEMTVKLRLVGGKLSVTIAVANPQTLSAIEGDRDTITARLASGDQSLEALTIQRQSPSAGPQQESSASHGFANDSGSQNGASGGGSRASSDSEERPKPPARSNAGAGGAFGDLVV